MVGWLVNRSRPLVKWYLNKDVHEIIKYGYFAIFKRPGKTCAEELEDLKKEIGFNAKGKEEEKYLLRAGHGGVLDSMATGVLVVALCDGCKVLPTLLKSSKRYRVTAQLGVATDTYNNNGNIVSEKDFDHVTRPIMENALSEFVGEIWQKPPVYSALKISGKRAADYARVGDEIMLAARPVVCHSARCLEFDPPFFKLEISSGHGFYVRSLVHDLGKAVGSCAHVTALERTKHGPFTLEDCLHPDTYRLDDILSAIQEARRKYPKLAQCIENYWRSNGSERREASKEEGGTRTLVSLR